jgi:ferredoxin-NADP reductase
MPIRWYDAHVSKIINLATNTRQITLHIALDEGEKFDFLPGQFITLDLPIGEKRLQRWRSYSIVSAPSTSNTIDLCIVLNPTGLGTPYLFGLGVGDEVKFKGPDGGFVLPSQLDQEWIMICTGTGIAPFKSMIDYVVQHNIDYKKIHLILGTRYQSQILYEAELKALAEQDQRFIYDIALSREAIEGYHHGYVHDIYMQHYATATTDRKFMICGWSAMIDEAVAKLLIDCKYDRSKVLYELYG